MAVSLNNTAPVMNWNAKDKQQTFSEFRQWCKMWLNCKKVLEADQWDHIVLLLGIEGKAKWKIPKRYGIALSEVHNPVAHSGYTKMNSIMT